MRTTVRMALAPRDGLFCKDGRGWYTSDSSRGHALDWPWPSTVLGAVRTAWGRTEEEKSGSIFDAAAWRSRTAGVTLGRCVALRGGTSEQWTSAHRAWPAPLDALRLQDRDEMHRLNPVEPPLPTIGRDDDPEREGLWVPLVDAVEKQMRAPAWWSEARLVAWLSGRGVPSKDEMNAFDAERRVQVHVGIAAATHTAKEGVLFSHDVVETLEPGLEWAVGLEASLPGSAAPSVATLGSDGRLARIEALPEAVFAAPQRLMESFRRGVRGLRLVVVTPACFQYGWLPDGLVREDGVFRGVLPGLKDRVVLRAALVSRPIHVSGWDMAEGGPKKTDRMVAPGAVFFFERVDGREFSEADAQNLWLAAVGARTEEGFGRVVPGVWTPTRSNR